MTETVHNAFLNNIKIIMDYSVADLTFYVYDSGNEIISRKYPVIPMLVPQNFERNEAKEEVKKEENI